jgi:hypothetical protein
MLKNVAEGGVNTFISEQQAIPDEKAFLKLVQFDNEYGVVYDGPLAGAPKYTMTPRGSTSLLDAIGRTLADLKLKAKKRDKVIVNIITDGQENSSVDWTKASLKKTMDECRKLGWKFEFMVANEKAMADAHSYGFAVGAVHTYDLSSAGVTRGYSNMSSVTTSLRTDWDTDFTVDPLVNSTPEK